MSSNEEQMYPADRPVRAWSRHMDGNGDFKSDVAFAVGQTWEDETPRWYNVSLCNVDGRTTVESAKILPEGTTDDLQANGYYRETVGGMLNFVQTLASFVMAAEGRAADNYTMAFVAKARLEQFQDSLNKTYGDLLKMKNADDLPEHLGLIGKYPSGVPDDDRQMLVIPTYPDKWAAGEYDTRPLAWRSFIYRVIDGSKVLVVSHETYGNMTATDWLAKGLKLAPTFSVLHTLANAADTAAWASNKGLLTDEEEFPTIALVHKHETEDGEPRRETMVYPLDIKEWEKDPNRRGGISWQAVEVTHGFDGLEVTAEWTADGVTEMQFIGQGYRPIEVNDLLGYATAFASQGPADAYIRAEKADVAYWKAQAKEFETRIKALAADAHRWADDNKLGPIFDEFMEEHGLPARLRDWTVKVEVPITLEFTVEDMSNAEDARKEAERYVEQELRGLNDIAGMDLAWIGDPDGEYAEVVGD